MHAHWIGVQSFIYSHAWHGSLATMPGWNGYLWQAFNRRQTLLVARHPDAAIAQVERFISGLDIKPKSVMLETCPGLHAKLEATLEENGWKPGYDLPGHFIPTGYVPGKTKLLQDGVSFRGSMGLAELPEWFTLREVVDRQGAEDFAYVQDLAYRESYDWPRGCAAMFYADVASLVGPDTLAAVVYDAEDRPVRTAQLIRANGIVSGVAGAAVPRVRGQHLGEPLVEYLRLAAKERFGADDVFHVTMPAARPIAARLGLEQVTMFRRWVAK